MTDAASRHARTVRREGEVIRYNMPWTLAILISLIGIGLLHYFVLPHARQP